MKKLLFIGCAVVALIFIGGCKKDKDNSLFDFNSLYEDGIVYLNLGDTTVEVTYLSYKIQPPKDVKYKDEVSIPALCQVITIGTASIGMEVVGIGDSAFYDCPKLISVSLPHTILYVKKHAFAHCAALTTIICKSLNPPTIDQTTFDDTDVSKITLYVPLASVEAYKKDPIWGQMNVKTFDTERE